jgi:hypothetical protein
VRAAVESGPKFFHQLMEAPEAGMAAMALDELRQEGVLGRNPEGAYVLQNQTAKQSCDWEEAQ